MPSARNRARSGSERKWHPGPTSRMREAGERGRRGWWQMPGIARWQGSGIVLRAAFAEVTVENFQSGVGKASPSMVWHEPPTVSDKINLQPCLGQVRVVCPVRGHTAGGRGAKGQRN